jgi:hypothetical protein
MPLTPLSLKGELIIKKTVDATGLIVTCGADYYTLFSTGKDSAGAANANVPWFAPGGFTLVPEDWTDTTPDKSHSIPLLPSLIVPICPGGVIQLQMGAGKGNVVVIFARKGFASS